MPIMIFFLWEIRATKLGLDSMVSGMLVWLVIESG